MLIYFFGGNCWPQICQFICRYVGRTIPVGIADIGYSVWPTTSCNSCGMNGYNHLQQDKRNYHLIWIKFLNYVRTPNNDTFLLLLVAAVLGLAPQTGVCKCTKVTWQLIVHNETAGLRRSTKIKHLRLGHTCKGRRTLSEVLRLKSCSFSQKVI